MNRPDWKIQGAGCPTGSGTIREMERDMTGMPEKFRDLAGNYQVQVIQMRHIPKEALEEMQSDLKYVLGLMKCAGCRKSYVDYINSHREFFSHIPRSAVDVIDACIHMKEMTQYLQFTDKGRGEEEADPLFQQELFQEYGIKGGFGSGCR